jgi:PLP dependent protein
MEELSARLEDARSRMVDAGADPASVTVVAVTKGFGPEAVRAALEAGLADVGENYAQELVGKAAEIAEPVRWHFLGAPQRNKIPALAPLVALWQGVDRGEVLDTIARRRPGASVLVEVNVAGDEAKHGCRPEDAAGLVERGRDLGLDVRGLMTVAPAGDRHGAQRCFAELAGMAGGLGLKELSMGMSDDFDLAVAEGATMVRLGRALFGPRPVPARARR